MYQIEKNIPIPPPKTSGGREPKYPMDQLQVGDSFFVPEKSAGKFSGSIGYYRRKNPDKKFTSRNMDGGTRIWRVA